MEFSPSDGDLRAKGAHELWRVRTARAVNVDAMLRQMGMLNSSGLRTGLLLPPGNRIHYFFRKSWP